MAHDQPPTATSPARVQALVEQALRSRLALAALDPDRPLDQLGLDSHGLMTVLLEVERALGLSTPLDLPDEALASARTLGAAIAQAVAHR